MRPKLGEVHLVFLAGRPAGSYSLRKYCIKSLIENPQMMDSVDMAHGKVIVHRFTLSQAISEKISLQKELMLLFKDGKSKNRPAWMKQRAHWNKFLSAVRNGESLETFLE